MKKILLAGAALSLAIFSACSSDDHSTSVPEGENQSSSSLTLDDIDKLLGSSSSVGGDAPKSGDSKSSSSVAKLSSSSDEDELSSSSEKTVTSSSSAIVVDDDGFKRAACDLKSDEGTLLVLDLINEKAIKMFEAFAENDMEEAKSLSADVKPMYKKVLDKDAKNCNAQLGYAIASIVNLANNPTLRELYNDYKYWYDYRVESVAEFTEMLADLSKNKSFTKIAQEALDNEVAPMVDSAITFMQNIMAQGDYVLNIRDGEYIRELDNSEFGVALGGLFATKAAVAMATSMNLEIGDKDGSYEWINGLNALKIGNGEPTDAQKAAIIQMEKLMGMNGLFTTIYTDRQKAWTGIPDLIDSAISEARAAFLYSLSESRKNSQENDLYVVGNGADADVSVDDILDIIDGLEEALDVTRGEYEVDINGHSVVINARKFFANVDGIEAYLPYYKFDGKDLTTFKFLDEKGRQETVSLLDFVDGDLSFPGDAEGNVFFKDPSFGGIFPKFKTSQDVWDVLKNDDE